MWSCLNDVTSNEFRPDMTLVMGQCFNWKGLPDCTFVGVINGSAVALKYQNNKTYYKILSSVHSNVNEENIVSHLKEYFQLKYSLQKLYSSWILNCDRMRTIATSLEGVRVLKQDPWECLVSFICSSNNNIKRITLMLDRLRFRYGKYLCSVEFNSSPSTLPQTDECIYSGLDFRVYTDSSFLDSSNRYLDDFHISSSPSHTSSKVSREKSKVHLKSPIQNFDNSEVDISNSDYTFNRADRVSLPEIISNKHLGSSGSINYHLFSFPTIEAISGATEAELRMLGMGYRAKFILGSAQKILSLGGETWLANLEEIGRNDMVFADSLGHNFFTFIYLFLILIISLL
jgi:N-glycosylase/DNA lyase